MQHFRAHSTVQYTYEVLSRGWSSACYRELVATMKTLYTDSDVLEDFAMPNFSSVDQNNLDILTDPTYIHFEHNLTLALAPRNRN